MPIFDVNDKMLCVTLNEITILERYWIIFEKYTFCRHLLPTLNSVSQKQTKKAT